MAKYKYKPLRYLIDQSYGDPSRPAPGKEVAGFAVQLPAPWHRFRVCIREQDIIFTEWRADHYDTGFSLIHRGDYATKDACVDSLLFLLAQPAKCRKLARSLRRLGFGWIADEVGL